MFSHKLKFKDLCIVIIIIYIKRTLASSSYAVPYTENQQPQALPILCLISNSPWGIAAYSVTPILQHDPVSRIRVSVSDTPIHLCAFKFCRNLTYPRIRIGPIRIRLSVSVLHRPHNTTKIKDTLLLMQL